MTNQGKFIRSKYELRKLKFSHHVEVIRKLAEICLNSQDKRRKGYSLESAQQYDVSLNNAIKEYVKG